jgi:hypothetical protein
MDTADETRCSEYVLKSITVTIAQADRAMRPFGPVQFTVRDTYIPAEFSVESSRLQTTLRHVFQKVVADLCGGFSDLAVRTSEAWSTSLSLTSDGSSVYSSWLVEPCLVRDGEVK